MWKQIFKYPVPEVNEVREVRDEVFFTKSFQGIVQYARLQKQ